MFNKPTKIGGTAFQYGPDHQRFKQVDGNRTVYYFNGGQYKEIETDAGTITRNAVGGYYVRETSGSGVKETYLHKDHLGSTGAMTDKWGNLVDRMSFGPWGKRQMADWSDGDPTGGQSGQYPTDKGFTGHEMLDATSLVHMNGRVYDPVIGRFLSPDLLVQAPYNSQSYNRYSYVFNNPLSLVDPSGYHGTDSSCQLSCLYTGPLGTVGLFSSISAGQFSAHYRASELSDSGVEVDPEAVEKMTEEEKKALVGQLKKMQEANGGYVKVNGEKYVISYDTSAAGSSIAGQPSGTNGQGATARRGYVTIEEDRSHAYTVREGSISSSEAAASTSSNNSLGPVNTTIASLTVDLAGLRARSQQWNYGTGREIPDYTDLQKQSVMVMGSMVATPFAAEYLMMNPAARNILRDIAVEAVLTASPVNSPVDPALPPDTPALTRGRGPTIIRTLDSFK